MTTQLSNISNSTSGYALHVMGTDTQLGQVRISSSNGTSTSARSQIYVDDNNRYTAFYNNGTERLRLPNGSAVLVYNGLDCSGNVLGTAQTYHRYHSSAQSFTHATDTTYLFDSSGSMTNGNSANVTYSAGTWTNSTGKTLVVHVCATVGFSNSTVGQRAVWIEHSSGKRVAMVADSASNTAEWLGNLSGYLTLANGESFTIRGYQSSGGALNSLQNATWQVPCAQVTVVN